MRKWIFLLTLIAGISCFTFAMGEEVVFQKDFKVDSGVEEMDMGNTIVKDMDAFVRFLNQLPNLKKVDMFNTRLYPKDIDRLAEAFPDIEFGWTMRIGDHWVRTDATAFSTLHNNKSTLHNENSFKYLKYCKNLLALDIGHNEVKDISFLYDLPNLRVLILACNFNIKDISPIGNMKDLEYLELFKNDINDISCLVNCEKLLDLNLCNNRIKDWTPLHEMKSLERLWLFNSNNYSDELPVDKKIINGIKAALPDCHVDSTSHSTQGGWRLHDRYYVIYHMFKHGEYISFDRTEEIKALYPEPINVN